MKTALAVIGGITVLLVVGVVAIALIAEYVPTNGSGASSGGGLGANCIVTNFGVELCGAEAVDHCQRWQELQAQSDESAAEMAEDAREMNRDAKRSARQYGGSPEDYGYDPDADEEAMEWTDDPFSEKSDQICQEILGSAGY